jgi:hypothetical protein
MRHRGRWDESKVKELLRRAKAEMQRGERRNLNRLPSSKSEFPKLLCLDMLHWIGLAQAGNGLQKGRRYETPLTAVEEAVSKGTLVVPICGANVLEAAKPGDARQRERLARFMVRLSGNQSLINNISLQHIQTEIALRTHYLREATGLAATLRRRMVLPGVAAAATGRLLQIDTGNSEVDAILNHALLDPEISVAGLVDALDRPTVATLRRDDIRAATRFSAIRELDKHLPADARRLLGMRRLLEEGSFADKVQVVLKELGVDSTEFRDWISEEDNLKKFTNAIPSVDVPATLMLHRDRNRDAPPRANDMDDLSFLEVAIPYANIVVAEKLWVNVANQTTLPQRYGTMVISDPGHLPDLLTAAGCV